MIKSKILLAFLIGSMIMCYPMNSIAMMSVPKPSEHKPDKYTRITLDKGQKGNSLIFEADQDFKVSFRSNTPGSCVKVKLMELDPTNGYSFLNTTSNSFSSHRPHFPATFIKTFAGPGHTYQIIIEPDDAFATGEAIIYNAKEQAPEGFKVSVIKIHL